MNESGGRESGKTGPDTNELGMNESDLKSEVNESDMNESSMNRSRMNESGVSKAGAHELPISQAGTNESGVNRSGANEAAMVPISLDGRDHAVPAGSTLADVVASLGHAPNKVTTAVNGTFVARPQREACVLQAGDAVLLFQPIVGG